MNRSLALFVSRAVLMISLLPIQVIEAADTKPVELAPIPTQIATAKKVFIANAGGDDPGIYEALFNRDVDRSYNLFYAAMKSAGRYELVGSPAERTCCSRSVLQSVSARPTYILAGAAGDPTVTLNSAWQFAIPRPTLFFGDSPNTWNGLFCKATGTRISIKPLPALSRTY